MKKSIIDAKGELCPKPLIMTKKALENSAISGTFDLLLDNETSRENVERFLLDNNIDFFSSDKEGYFVLTISKKGESVLTSEPEEYCSPAARNTLSSSGHVVCFKKDKMGSGDDDLGSILIKGCINTLKEISPLPEKIIFYNSSVKLAISSSPVIDSLKELEKSGVIILICGTCADYYKIKSEITVGKISNMYDILDALTSSSKVIFP